VPFFSVITPSFNQGAYIGECAGSVLAQNDADFEHLVFDNCSTDSTSSVLAGFPHLKVTREKDRGQSDAVNRGFQAATGEIICWLNSDDAYPPGLFARLREVFAAPSVQVVFGDVTQIAYDGSAPLRVEGRFDRREDMVRWWRSDVRLHQPAIFFRSSVQRATGLLREDLHLVMDYEYWWRMSEKFAFHHLPEVLAIQHRQPESKTVLDWQGVFAEREKVFSPFYQLVDGGDRQAFDRERRHGLAERYLGEAYHNATAHPQAALRAFVRSLKEAPAYGLHPRSLGLLRRLDWRRLLSSTK